MPGSPTRFIPLTHQLWALVDAADYPALCAYRWRADLGEVNSTWYATSAAPAPERTNLKMHRLIMRAPDDMEVDHINMDGLDNRRCNLRLVTRSQNRRNLKLRSNNTSGYKGVSFRPDMKRWIAYISVDAKRKHLGFFETAEIAAHAYDAAAVELHGEYGRLNFPP